MKYKTIMTTEYDRCYICGREASDWHHVMHGADKHISEEYGLMVPLCRACHTEVHSGRKGWDLKLKQEAQRQLLVELTGRCYL